MAEEYSIYAQIKADSTNFKKGMKQAQDSAASLSKTIGNLQKVIKTTMSLAGLGVGVSSVVRFGKASVEAAESANKSLQLLNNTLKVTGATAWTTSQDMVKMSEEIAHSTNYSVGEIQDLQSVLLGFKNITGDTFENATTAITDMATVMGMDLKSAVQTVGKALDDPIKGLDSLRRQGFAFTDEQKQEMQILVENGEIIKAQNLILQELETTYGGAAKAARSGFDAQRDAVLEFKETLGNQLMPVMEQLASSSADTFNKLSEAVQGIDFASIAAEIETVVDVTKQFIQIFYDNFVELFKKLVPEFEEGTSIFKTFRNNVYNTLNEVYKLIQNCFGLINALIEGDWATAWDYAKLIILKLVKAVNEAFNGIYDKFKGFFDKMNLVTQVLAKFGVIPAELSSAMALSNKAFEKVSENAKEIGERLQKEIDEVCNDIEKRTGKTAEIELENMDNVDERREKYVRNAEKGNLELKDSTEVVIEEEESAYKRLMKLIKANADVTKKWAQNILKAFAPVFEQLGEDLANGEVSWRNYAQAAVEGIAEVLKALAEEMTARAALAVASGNWAKAAALSAGAAATLVASSYLKTSAQAFTKTTEAIKNNIEVLAEYDTVISDVADNLKKLQSNLESIESKETSIGRYYSSVKGIATELQNATGLVRTATTNLATAENNALRGQQRLVKERDEALTRYQDALNNEKHNAKVYYKKIRGKSFFWSNTDEREAQIEAWEFAKGLTAEFKNDYEAAAKAVRNYSLRTEDVIAKEKELADARAEVIKVTEAQNKIAENIANNIKAENDEIQNVIDSYKDFYSGVVPKVTGAFEMLVQEQRTKVLNTLQSVVSELQELGNQIGNKLIQNITNGATQYDFLKTMKSYIREQLLKLSVYTEEFTDKLSEVGTKVASALMGETSLKEARKDIEALYRYATTQAEKAERLIEEAFGDIADGVKNSVDDVEKQLTRFEQLMESFKDSVSDVGGDIGSTLVDSLSNGLTQGDFLSSMKTWLKKMLVQATVYTESMKTEIEAIGKAITKGITEGFTDTSLHEIRRDLSWVFEKANATVANIDSLLQGTFSGYASGTDNATAGLHLVGEAGPELVRFRGGEQVMNARDTQNLIAGNKSNTFNVTFNNTKDTTAFAMMSQLKQYNRNLAFNGIL